MPLQLLIAEDEAELAAIVRDYALAEGWAAQIVGDGVTALERVRQGGIDLLVLDLMLPRLDGLAVCAAVREAGDLPIVMLTADGSEHDIKRALENGANDYMIKPFNPRELTSRLKRFVGQAA